MINDDILIKFFRNNGYKHLEWVDRVNYFKQRLEKIKLGFPGIGNNHLSLSKVSDLQKEDLFILDPYLFNLPNEKDDEYMTAMYKLLNDTNLQIEGIGCGENRLDPDRKIRWGDITMNMLNKNDVVLKVDVRPTENGGPGYYYFYKAYRDNRD